METPFYVSKIEIERIFVKKSNFLNYMFVIWYDKKRRNEFDIQKKKKDVENKTGILYNDTVNQLKGM